MAEPTADPKQDAAAMKKLAQQKAHNKTERVQRRLAGSPQMFGGMIREWQELRREIGLLEAAEHPPVTDHHGRVWTWVKGDLYRHDDMAWPLHSITDTRHGLPSESARNNPNYRLCDICKGVTTDAS